MSSAERRSAQRLSVDLELELQLSQLDASRVLRVRAQLVDLGADGNGAGLHVPLRSPIMLGGAVSLLFVGVQPVAGIVVSRLGTPRYERLGIRIDRGSAARVRELARTLPPPA